MTISTIIASAISAVLGVSPPCWPQLPLAVGLVTATVLSNCRRDIGPFLCLGNPSCNDCLRQSHAFQIEGSGAWWKLRTARPKCQELQGMGRSSFRGSWNVGSVKKGTESNWLALNRVFAHQNLENMFSVNAYDDILERALDLESGEAGFKHLLFHLLTLWPWESHSTLLSLHFLRYKGEL